jgi:putative ABC transport system permease protein
MLGLTWISGLLRRRTARLIGQTFGLALVVMLLASLGTFFTASRAKMTRQAIAAVPVDWQVQLTPGADPTQALKQIASAPGVRAALPVGYATTTGFTSKTGGTVQTTGPGKVLGLPPGYAATFPGEIRYLVGAHDGVLLTQQTAANLHAGVGSVVSVGRPQLPPFTERVVGVVDLPAADSMFQAIGLTAGSGPAAPPDNVMLLPAAVWKPLFEPGGVPASGVTTQVHVGLSSSLPSDPSAAFAQVVGRAKNLEAVLAGAGLVGDNVGAQLDAARSDAIYAQLLFVLLGLPGAILAGLLAAAIAASGRDRRRAEQALLRTRGASPRKIVRLTVFEALLTGVVGAALGLGGAVLAGRIAFRTSRFGATTSQAIIWGATAIIVGFALAVVMIALPARRDARLLTVRSAQTVVGRGTRPLWARLYLDLVCLAVGGLVYWQAVKSGYQVVLAPEGVPTISVSYFTLLAPVLLWVGAALLTWRLGSIALSAGRRVLARITRPIAHGLSGVVAASMSRQRRLLSRGLVIMALTASFALSVAVFNTTYAAQARVDAELTNGADVSVQTAAAVGLPASLPPTAGALPGVASVQPMQHRFAYVGTDLQDLYGIDPNTIGQATNMSDAFFAGGGAKKTLAALKRTPDGVLVSDETVHDFQLQPGDLIRLRLQFASDNAYHVVPFHYVGIVREFPTAPRDSFLVANASYVGQQTGSTAFQTLLVKTTGSPPAVAAAIRRLLGPASGATVQDIVTQQRITLSGLTAIDLNGLTRLELTFAVILAAAGSGLVLALGLSERRRTFAIASALGARSHQLAAFVWSEAAFVTIGGIVLGALTGWGVSFVIVKILTGVFDPPPQHLSAPWSYLAVVAGASVIAAIAAGAGMVHATRRPAIEIIRDL